MSRIGGIEHFKSPRRVWDGPGGTYNIFDMYIDTLVEEEESTSSQAYVDVGHSVSHTPHRYGFPLIGVPSNQEWAPMIRTSDAAVTVYVRYMEDAVVMAEDSHDGDTNWSSQYFTQAAPTAQHTYKLQLRTSGAAIAYIKRGTYVRNNYMAQAIYVLR